MNWLLTEDGFYLLLENGVILQTELPPDLVPVDWCAVVRTLYAWTTAVSSPVDWTGSLSARYAWHGTAAVSSPVDWSGSLSARYAWRNTATRVARWTNAIAPVYTWTYQMEILSCG